MKTLEDYKIEFENFLDFENLTLEIVEQYEQLALACIADYPLESFGYEKYGVAIAADYFMNQKDNKIELLANLAKNDSKFIKAEQSFLENFPIVNIEDHIRDLIYREEREEFAEIYFLLGKRYANNGVFNFAIEDFAIAHDLGVDYKRFIEFLNPQLSFVDIKNFFCLNSLHLEHLSDKKEIYFLGENGVGKTLLLQAIVLGLIQNDHNGRKKIYNNFDFETKPSPAFQVAPSNDIQKAYNYQNLFAYGVGRFYDNFDDHPRYSKYGIETLFYSEYYLTNALAWLYNLVRIQQDGNAVILYEDVLTFLERILNVEGNTQIQIEYDKDTSKFIFYENRVKTQFKHLADGYRSMLILLCDLLRRLVENQPYITVIKDFYGIVLIDEIDMFLHPKWEYKIVRLLRKELPNIQWIFTTHSPMLILGASAEDAVFYKLYREDKRTKISEPWYSNDLMHLMANGIITSPLFDMETAQMHNSTFANAGLNMWHSEIIKKIDEKVSKQKAEGKAYFSKVEIDRIVEGAKKAMEELENDTN